ncbi:MAG: hypothetical protein M1825_003546 [Sarcosagium campestre]|nr:MAG: hypothetical protein M1825_003546 [Sarcosagium campestre]
MAPSSGLLVPMAMRIVRQAVRKTTSFVRTRLAESNISLNGRLQPVLVRATARQPIHPAAIIRQSRGRWYTTHSAINASVRRFTSSSTTSKSGVKYDRSSFPTSSVGTAVIRSTARAPFASTLRPNLTGGTLPRTAGGYASAGAGRIGGVRHFSHTPAMPAEVVNNVSAAVRAFWLSGKKAQFDGVDGRTGEKRFRAVSAAQDQASRTVKSSLASSPGSYIDFHVQPTITALGPMSSGTAAFADEADDSLTKDGLLDTLSSDFAHALRDLAAIMADLKRLSAIGSLPLSMPDQSTIRVSFPGCDAGIVESLCDELGVRRGIIQQDDDFDLRAGADLALLFPFAPSDAAGTTDSESRRRRRRRRTPRPRAQDSVDWRDMMYVGKDKSSLSAGYSHISGCSSDQGGGLGVEELERDESSWLYPSSAYSDGPVGDGDGDGARYFGPALVEDSSRYEGIEGIYRFIGECDGARR